MRRLVSDMLPFAAALVALVAARALPAEVQPLVLLVQPVPEETPAPDAYRALADFIETATASPCTLEMPPNFPAYWEAVRRNHYSLALDAPHFTDYRVQKFGFRTVAKTANTTSYSLVVRNADRLRDPGLLVGKRIASLGLLSVGTLRLNVLYPNAVRQPVLVDVPSTEEGVRRVRDENVDAAFLPTAAVSRFIPDGDIAVVLTTEPIPNLGLSASPRLAGNVVAQIRAAILKAHTSERGRAMLRALGIERFEAARPEDFANQSYVLRGYWGY